MSGEHWDLRKNNKIRFKDTNSNKKTIIVYIAATTTNNLES